MTMHRIIPSAIIPDYDDKRASDQNNPVPSGISRFEVHQPTVTESFINRLNSQINSLTDEQILNICDLKFHRYKQNYQVGNRRNSIFQQAAVLCRAGIESVKTLQYLESVFIPAGSPLHEIQAEVSKAYRTYGNLFGSERVIIKAIMNTGNRGLFRGGALS